jgi:hypothetical protein
MCNDVVAVATNFGLLHLFVFKLPLSDASGTLIVLVFFRWGSIWVCLENHEACLYQCTREWCIDHSRVLLTLLRLCWICNGA